MFVLFKICDLCLLSQPTQPNHPPLQIQPAEIPTLYLFFKENFDDHSFLIKYRYLGHSSQASLLSIFLLLLLLPLLFQIQPVY